MNIRSAISAPLPWLTFIASIIAKGHLKNRGQHGTIKPQTLRTPLRLLPRTLQFTKDGIRFIVVLILIGVAAINTGNNLLYLIVAMMLSLIVISGIMSESTIKKLTVKRVLPRYFFKDTPVKVHLKVQNHKRIIPSYSFTIEETGCPEVTATTAYMIKVDANKKGSTNTSYTFNRRGIHHLRELHIKTRFPFGLFIKGRHLNLPEELLVFPAIKSLTLTKSSSAKGTRGDSCATVKKGTGTELYGLKSYTFGEDSRLIHWKASAKMQSNVIGKGVGGGMKPAPGQGSGLLQKEFEDESSKEVTLNFRNLSSKYKNNDAAYTHNDAAFEAQVDETALLLSSYIEAGFMVGLRTLSTNTHPMRGKAQLYKLLKVMALVAPEGRGAPSFAIDEANKGNARHRK